LIQAARVTARQGYECDEEAMTAGPIQSCADLIPTQLLAIGPKLWSILRVKMQKQKHSMDELVEQEMENCSENAYLG
jgi:hypothetical protein